MSFLFSVKGSYQGDEAVINVILDIFGYGIWIIIEVGIQTFFWLTLVFAIIETTDKGKDTQPLTTKLQKWTPDDFICCFGNSHVHTPLHNRNNCTLKFWIYKGRVRELHR